MAKILEMPKLSPTMEEGVLSLWHKKEGDAVGVDDLLAEVETDKATMEFRAFDKGTILKLLVAPGANVKLGQPVAIVGNAGEDISALLAQTGASAGAPAAPTAAAAAPAAPPAAGEPAPPPAPPPISATMRPAVAEQPVQLPPMGATAPPSTLSATPGAKKSMLDRTEHEAPNGGLSGSASPSPGVHPAGGERVLASPYVRKNAREMGIDLQGAKGSGPGGRVVPADLDAMKQTVRGPEQALARVAPPPAGARALAVPGLAEPEVRPLSMMRKTIARRLVESKQTVPHFYLSIDVDADELVRMRERINVELGTSSGPPSRTNGGAGEAPPLKVSLNDIIVKACAAALIRVPECNAQFTPEAILVHRRVDISVAVAIAEGLVTPVVRNADQKSLVTIAREVRELAARARAKKLSAEEMTNGTFSISNLGMFGIDAFSAVINPPEGAILAVGQVRDVPVVRDGAVVPGKKLALTLSCDHRVVDGAVGAAFLAELRSLLEHPMRVLTG